MTRNDPLFDLLLQLDELLARTDSLGDAGLLLSYLLGKWVTQVPTEAREGAMLLFSRQLDEAIAAQLAAEGREGETIGLRLN